MTRQLRKITIHDYKGIHELTLSNLNAINILTGNNNSGKTSILELLATTNNPSFLSNWVYGLRTNSSPSLGYYRYGSYFEGFINLFPCNQDEKTICYDFVSDAREQHSVKVIGKIIDAQLPESELNRINGFMKTGRKSKDEDEVFIDVHGINIEIFQDNERLKEETIFDMQRRLPMAARILKSRDVILVSPVEHEGYNKYLNIIFRYPEYYELLVNMLLVFDKNLVGINAVKDEDGLGIVNYLVQSKKHKRSLPLSAYGDGMKKAILLLSALIQAKDGILLIDEFETGIHTSGMDQVFRLLLENAVKLNVQVFMTTHSKEALSKVIHMPPELQEKINLYTLYRRDGKNLVRPASCLEAVEMEDELGLELR